ncbi:MAG TPA: hypothetical protein VGT61_14275 [Thermomicrobiales bacterium]|jgi:mannose/fructose/N-acetylgalactosamine-specific phosphotransferase system component IIC|nr:hypothetical protein [Thermomicrobiales bacterium]
MATPDDDHRDVMPADRLPPLAPVVVGLGVGLVAIIVFVLWFVGGLQGSGSETTRLIDLLPSWSVRRLGVVGVFSLLLPLLGFAMTILLYGFVQLVIRLWPDRRR